MNRFGKPKPILKLSHEQHALSMQLTTSKSKLVVCEERGEKRCKNRLRILAINGGILVASDLRIGIYFRTRKCETPVVVRSITFSLHKHSSVDLISPSNRRVVPCKNLYSVVLDLKKKDRDLCHFPLLRFLYSSRRPAVPS
jgi:hypothetical protein